MVPGKISDGKEHRPGGGKKFFYLQTVREKKTLRDEGKGTGKDAKKIGRARGIRLFFIADLLDA